VDEGDRQRRREEARRRTYRQRRLALAGVVALVVLGVAVPLLLGGDNEAEPAASDRAAEAPAPLELPRGGREILPRYRVVGFYGAPQDDELGELGIGTPDQAAERLDKQARPYARGKREVLPALELIAVVAAGAEGDDGMYRTRQRPAVIRRYLEAARRHEALLLLDVQPGRADFMSEVRALEPFLREPDVSLALDPEWHVAPGEIPGQVIGSVDAAQVNEIADYLAAIVREHELPQKLLVVHQFTEDMVANRAQLREPPGIALVLNADGFGTAVNKVAKYDLFASRPPRAHRGFKLFYREDEGLMTPRDVLRLRPQPELIVYE
jgi:hypothetical protein